MSVEPTKAQAHVFLSYSRVDRAWAEAIARLLAGNGVAVWIDQVDIPGGTSWSGEIVRGIRSCVTFVVLCSKAAMASSNVQRELQLALDHQRPILPLVLEAAEIPDAFAYGLAGAQQVRVGERSERDWLPEVLRALAVLGAVAVIATVPTISLPPRRRHNLPAEITSFIGREREQEEVKDALAKSRLLTLSGIGGIGKTRLSLQIAAAVADDYPDGVWFVELAPITDAGLVRQTVASVLGVKEEAGRSLGDALVDFVRDRALLLVLDNCEHLVAPCADLARQLLKAGPKLKILASSRELFHISGERVYTVPPLSLPDPGRGISADSALRFESVHLFVERAKSLRPSFTLSDHNADLVAAICQRLDGIPLALELAAGRARALSIEEIAARVTDRFRLLTGGDRTAQPRQQTLRKMIDWSYHLLTETERVLFRRLAVFVGGWTLEAAENVVSWGDVDETLVLDLLAALVEKSLIVIDAEGARYGLLETVRQYADEQLAQAAEGDAARTRHLAYYASLAEAARPHFDGPGEATWVTRIDLERENLLAAHAWCDHAPDGAALGLRLAHAVYRYWQPRGLMGLGHRVAIAALARPGTQGRTLERSRGLFEAGQLCGFMGRHEEAKALLDESLGIARDLGDRFQIAKVLQPLAMTASELGDLATARHYVEEAVQLARALGDKHELTTAINGLAQLHRVDRRLDLAEPLYEQAIALARELADSELVAIGLLNIAMVWIGRDAGARAYLALAEAIATAQALGNKAVGQGALDVVTGLAAWNGEHERAARWFGAAQAQMLETGLQRDSIDQLFLTPLVDRSRAALGNAAFATAESAGGMLHYDSVIDEARAWVAAAVENAPVSSASKGP